MNNLSLFDQNARVQREARAEREGIRTITGLTLSEVCAHLGIAPQMEVTGSIVKVGQVSTQIERYFTEHPDLRMHQITDFVRPVTDDIFGWLTNRPKSRYLQFTDDDQINWLKKVIKAALTGKVMRYKDVHGLIIDPLAAQKAEKWRILHIIKTEMYKSSEHAKHEATEEEKQRIDKNFERLNEVIFELVELEKKDTLVNSQNLMIDAHHDSKFSQEIEDVDDE